MNAGDREHLGLYLTLGLIALLIAGVTTTSAVQEDRLDFGSLLFPLVLVTGAIAALAFGILCDPITTSRYCAVWASIAALGLGLVRAFGEGPHPVAGPASVLMVLLAAACFALPKSLTAHAPPDVLARDFPRSLIGEHDGIQFVCQVPGTVIPGECFFIALHLQNCWDAACKFSLQLEPENPEDDIESLVTTPTAVSAELAALEVGILNIPVMLDMATKPSMVSIVASPSVSGARGRRCRTKRAPEIHRRVSRAETLIGATIGLALGHIHIHGGGGLKIHLNVAEPREAPQPAMDSVGREAQFKSVWLPPSSGTATES